MAPIRRYLRITEFSVLECRIYLDNPALAESWLFNARNPILPRVIESVRPLVLPKLREENERSKKGGKKKGVKDVVVTDDFEVSIFLTETTMRHSLLVKHKHFREPNKKAMQSNSRKLMGATNDTAIEVEDAPVIRTEESDDEGLDLQELPPAAEDSPEADSLFVEEDEGPRRSKRPRTTTITDSPPEVSIGSEPTSKRRKDEEGLPTEGEPDDKKKMLMDTSYDGFSIYGRVLCLVVKRRDRKGKGLQADGSSGGQAMMEDWIRSTQMPAAEDER